MVQNIDLYKTCKKHLNISIEFLINYVSV